MLKQARLRADCFVLPAQNAAVPWRCLPVQQKMCGVPVAVRCAFFVSDSEKRTSRPPLFRRRTVPASVPARAVISHAHSAVPPAALPLSYFLQGNAFPCPCQKFLPRCFGSVKNTENCIFCLFYYNPLRNGRLPFPI